MTCWENKKSTYIKSRNADATFEDEDYLYLNKDIAHKLVKKLCEEQGESFPVSARGLLSALVEEGIAEPGRDQNTKPLRVGDMKSSGRRNGRISPSPVQMGKNAGEAVFTMSDMERRILKMNSDYEKNDMTATSLEALIQANGQAVDTRQRIPYEMTVYAIPEQWREEEVKMLRTAVEFQPTLYKMIGKLATRQELQQMQEQYLYTIRMDQQEHLRSIRSTLQQDGSVREKHSSEISKMLSDSLKAMEAATVKLEQKVRKLLIASVVASTAASVLACVVWHLLAS